MIKLSRLTDYAIVLLSQMAADGNGVYAATALAEKSFLPLPTVSKVLKQLAKAGLLVAQRGASGGYSMARDPAAISMTSLIEALDGPIAITDCAGTNDGESCCSIESTCPTHGNWDKVNDAIRHALETVTLADMTAKRQSCENRAFQTEIQAH